MKTLNLPGRGSFEAARGIAKYSRPLPSCTRTDSDVGASAKGGGVGSTGNPYLNEAVEALTAKALRKCGHKKTSALGQRGR